METPYGGLWYAATNRAGSGSGQLIVPPHRVLFTSEIKTKQKQKTSGQSKLRIDELSA